MNTQQAYIEGFVKRAAEYGLSREEAFALLKQAGPVSMPTRASMLSRPNGPVVADPFTADPFNLKAQAAPAAPAFTPLQATDPGAKGMSPKALEGYNNAQQMRSLLGQQVLPPPTAAPSAGYTKEQLSAAKNDIGNPRK